MMSRRRLAFARVVVVIVAVLEIGCDERGSRAVTGRPAATVQAAQADETLGNYKTSMRLMTPEPVWVDPELAGLCRGLDPVETEAIRRRSGPHALMQINVYMNDLAANSFRDDAVPFPAGSIVVKDKLGGAAGQTFGAIIKRGPGFDTENGDWEYVFVEQGEPVAKQKLISCAECHAAASPTDFVFGYWAPRGR